MPQSVIEDAAQLVKANSIQGNKMNDVDVVGRSFARVFTAVCTQLCTPDLSFMTPPKVYTMWDNLHKTNGMDVGQIGFHKQKAVRKIRLASRENAIVNRLNKTKVIRASCPFCGSYLMKLNYY